MSDLDNRQYVYFGENVRERNYMIDKLNIELLYYRSLKCNQNIKSMIRAYEEGIADAKTRRVVSVKNHLLSYITIWEEIVSDIKPFLTNKT